MATYIPGLTDQIPQAPLYTPDYSFMERMLRKKDMQYEQGFAQVKGAFNNIMNATLTKESLIEARDQYVKEARQQLADLPGVDLSLPENIAAADKVFAPFWEDKEILKDYLDTRQQTVEIQKQYAMQESPDENIRSQFSTIPLALMQERQDKIRTAKRGDMSVYSQPVVKSTPFYNRTADFMKFIKENDFKIVYSNTVDGRIVMYENGEGTRYTYQELAQAIGGTKYQAQENMMGKWQALQAQKQIVSDYAQRGITLSETEATALIPEYYAGEMKAQQETTLADLKLRKKVLKEKGDAAVAAGDLMLLEESAKAVEALNKSIEEVEDGIKVWGDKNSDRYKETAKSISYDPARFFAQLYSQREINTAAALAASKQSTKVDSDGAYWQRATLEQAWKIHRDDMDMKWNIANLPGGGVNGSGTTTPGSAGSVKDINNDGIDDTKQSGVIAAGLETPSVEKAKNANIRTDAIAEADAYLKRMNFETVSGIFDALKMMPNSVVGKYISSDEAATLSVAVINGNGIGQEQYKKAYSNVVTRLKNAGVIKYASDIKGPMGLVDAVIKQLDNDHAGRVKLAEANPANKDLGDQVLSEAGLIGQLLNSKKALDDIWARETAFKAQVKGELQDKKYEKITYEANGERKLIDAGYIGKTFGIPKALAQLYIDGKINYHAVGIATGRASSSGPEKTTRYFTSLDNRSYDITPLFDKHDIPKNFARSLETGRQLLNTSGKIQSAFMDVFNGATGLQGKVAIYTSDGTDKMDVADIAATSAIVGKHYEVINDSAIMNADYDSDTRKPAQLVFDKMQSAPGNGLTRVEMYTRSPNNPQRKAMRLVVSADRVNSILTEAERKNYKDELQKFLSSDGGILLELKEGANVKGMPNQANMGYYEMLLKENTGKVVLKQSEREEALGLHYQVYRDPQGQVMYRVGSKQVKPDPNDKTKTITRWVDPLNPELSEDQAPWRPIPAGTNEENFMQVLQQNALDIYRQNRKVIYATVPPQVSLQQTAPEKISHWQSITK